jgi:ferredoxin
MAMKITDDCISCGACAPDCPVEAISEGDTIYVIDPDKCVECQGYHDSPQCVAVCPVEAIVKA